MEHSGYEIAKERQERKESKEEKYKRDSKKRFSDILEKKFKTTTVGCISALEEIFGFLWDENVEPVELSHGDFYDLYQLLRAKMFDLGNAQKRNMLAELEQYEIEWKRYHLQLPVKEGKRVQNS